MADSTMIESDIPEVEEPKKKQTRTRAPKKNRKNSSYCTESEVTNAFHYFFRFYGWFRKSDTLTDEKELKEFAKHYVVLAQRIKFLNEIVRALAPLAAAGEFIKHFSKVEAGAKKPFPNILKRKKKPRPEQPPIVVDTEAMRNEAYEA